MMTIHALRSEHYVTLPEQEFSLLIRTLLQTHPVEVIETAVDDLETEDDRLTYRDALQELEQGATIDFDAVNAAWLQGEPAHVHLAT
jgi:hypothetical protein